MREVFCSKKFSSRRRRRRRRVSDMHAYIDRQKDMMRQRRPPFSLFVRYLTIIGRACE